MNPPKSAWSALLEELEGQTAVNPLRARWLSTARPEQITPPGDWSVWLVCAGRGFGKSRLGSEDLIHFGLTHPGSRLAVIASTFADVRDTCIEGQSGLLGVLPRDMIETYNRSMAELVLKNGTRIRGYSAEDPDRLRGPQFHRALCDELAAWSRPETFDMLMFGMRLGDHPQVVVTTTPKPSRLLKALLTSPTTHVTRGSTFDNAANLPRAALDQLRSKYEGTRLGRQELHAEVLEDMEGALWTLSMIEKAQVSSAPVLRRIVVGVDPSGSNGTSGDAQGIVVVGLGEDGHVYVLADATVRESPERWARTVKSAFDKFLADRVVAEANYGGAMVESTLRAVDPSLPVTLVNASRGKHVRAEPVAALYEQGRVHHLGDLSALEAELLQMTAQGWAGSGSPNRLDALVWAITDLALGQTSNRGVLDYWIEEASARPAERPEPPRLTYARGSVEHTLGLAASAVD